MNSNHESFELGDIQLQSGQTLPSARLAFKTYGSLSPSRDNVILYPTAFGGLIAHNEARISEDLPLDPRRYFIIAVALFGNGQSSSPSNTPAPAGGRDFPRITIDDNVRAQRRLLVERFGIDQLELVIGFSMGALQAFHWAALFPDKVARMIAISGAARCARHNYVFLSSLRAALAADESWVKHGAKPVNGLKAFGRIIAGWGLSQAFYREEIYRTALGFASLDDFLEQFSDNFYQGHDPYDLLTMIDTWQHADIASLYDGDFERALGVIEAKTLIMPSETDLYFTVADNLWEAARMQQARCVAIPSIWGHIAGDGISDADDNRFTNAQIAAHLAE